MTGRVGVWLLGARGSVSTCAVLGVEGLRRGRLAPVGMVTAGDAFAPLELVPTPDLVFGGHEIRKGSLLDTAADLVRARVLPPDLVEEGRGQVAEVESRIRPGYLEKRERAFGPYLAGVEELLRRHPNEALEILRKDLRNFQRNAGVETVVVVNLTSTEALRDGRPPWDSVAAFRRDLGAGVRPPASVLYAAAAFEEGFPYVNFTPSDGASSPALQSLALERGVPHAGNDGKTGETLVKTALAPMFRARNLRVLSWEGYNLLGNRDGATLEDPAHRAAKVRSKSEGLREILRDPALHARVSIDFVPSLSDWKTAWDFVHFEGFFGVPMTLQFTWHGSDSALAAPLVLDLVRLVEFAKRRGERGALPQTACFFKCPLGVVEHDFHRQVALLEGYVRACAAEKEEGGASSKRTRRRVKRPTR